MVGAPSVLMAWGETRCVVAQGLPLLPREPEETPHVCPCLVNPFPA